jgi:glycosyltransferase involved in cell wall biosynthesis
LTRFEDFNESKKLVKIAYSSEASADIKTQMGTAHYSYRFVEEKFFQCLIKHGYAPQLVEHPEIFKSGLTFQALLGASAHDVVHIAFRSTENLRLLPGAWNIGHFAWEFDVLRDHNLITEAVTKNQLHMLQLLDEIWVSCNYTKHLLDRYGLTNVRIVPAPICPIDLPDRLMFEQAKAFLSAVPIVPLALSSGLTRDFNARLIAERLSTLGMQPAIANHWPGAAQRVFLMICNPHDCRKNILSIIEGFQFASGDSFSDILILKLIVPNVGDFRTVSLYDSILPRFDGPGCVMDPRVVIIFDYLSDEQMAALYSIADFYISAAHCEGFNLPLLEAMSYGTVPISTRNTAMIDYIDDTNAIVIPDKPYPSPVIGLAADIAGKIYDLPVASRFDIAHAFQRAKALSAEDYAHFSERARTTVQSRYSDEKVMPLVAERLEAVMERRKVIADVA